MKQIEAEEQDIAARIVRHLKSVLAGRPEADMLDGDSELIGGEMLDSLNVVRLIQFVESEFGVCIPDSAIGPDIFTSPRALARFIVRQG